MISVIRDQASLLKKKIKYPQKQINTETNNLVHPGFNPSRTWPKLSFGYQKILCFERTVNISSAFRGKAQI